MVGTVCTGEHFGGSQLSSLGDLSDFFVTQADDNILGLEIGVDNSTLPMHIIEAN